MRLDQWSRVEDNWVKENHPFAFEINSKIREKKTIFHEQLKRSYNANKNVTFETLIKQLERKGDRGFFGLYGYLY